MVEKIREKFNKFKNKILLISIILNVLFIVGIVFSITQGNNSINTLKRIERLGTINDKNKRVCQDFRRGLEIRERITAERDSSLARRQETLAERQRILDDRKKLEQTILDAITGIGNESTGSGDRIKSIKDRYTDNGEESKNGID